MSEALRIMLFSVLFALLIAFSAVSLCFGVFDEKCEYKSIATRFNPVYRLGCELVKPRY
jgi:hypothetical protein